MGDEIVQDIEIEPFGGASVSGPANPNRLNERQQEFARSFVLNGGNAMRAAIDAGYDSPVTMARKCLVHRLILAEIKRLSIVHTEALLPGAIRRLVELSVQDEDRRAAVQAVVKIIEMAGGMPKAGGPQVQVNLQVNGQQAQSLIAEVWSDRERRLKSANPPRLSGIGAAMTDTTDDATDA